MDTQISNFFKILKMIFDDKQEYLPNKQEYSPNKPVEWNVLSEIARKQNLLPLFFEAANRFEDYVKSDIYTKDQLDTFAMVAAQIQRSSAFIDIYKKITAEGIYPIVMKGIICRQLYGELGEHRPSGDEDILVEVSDFPKVQEILEREHYVCSVPDMTECGLEQIQEISFYNSEQRLKLEVHTNIIGKENDNRVQMNRLFQNVHEHGQIIQIDGVNIKVLEPTDSLLFLIVHAYKHFQNRGVGIRQVLDILLYYRAHQHEIEMDRLQDALKICKAENFWTDILYIGNQYIGLYEERPKIDMDTLCMGHPVFELGSMFNAFVGYSEHDHQNMKEFFGYSFETAGKFWNTALKMYLGTEDEAVCQSVAEKAMIIGYTRMLRRSIRRPNEAESPVRIARCKEMLAKLLEKTDSLCF